VSLCCIAFNR